MNQKHINSIMLEATQTAGEILRSIFNESMVEEISKSDIFCDVFSKADIESEKIIIQIISKKLPEVNILSEEKGFIDKNSSETIVIDPLDGSSNFLLGLPHFSICIAHFHLNEIVASVVYNPVLKKMYFAEKGKGAFVNGKKIQQKNVKNSFYVAINFHKTKWAEKRRIFNKLHKLEPNRVLNNWSPNLDFCLLAENKINAVISSKSLIYDFAPGFLIAKESGCVEFPRIEKIKLDINSSMSLIITRRLDLMEKIKNVI